MYDAIFIDTDYSDPRERLIIKARDEEITKRLSKDTAIFEIKRNIFYWQERLKEIEAFNEEAEFKDEEQ